MARRIWLVAGVGLLFVAGILALLQIVIARVEPLPVYMALPDVTLTDQDGRAFPLSQTRGKVVVMGIIYTNCSDICPLITSRMRQIQQKVQAAGVTDQIQLVSFTVDPEHDSPSVLKQFGTAFQVDWANWALLTGSSDQVQMLVKGLKVYVERVYYIDGTPVSESVFNASASKNASYEVNHTDRLFLIDRKGNVRALLPGSQTNVDEAIPLIQQLVRE
jgi:protein SCO1